MKIKKLAMGIILLSGALSVTACVNNKKVNPTTTATTPVTTDVTTTAGTEPVTTGTDPVVPTSTFIPTTTIIVDPIEDEDLLNHIYEDFNKASLPKYYVENPKDVFTSVLKIDSEKQLASIESADCIEQYGYDIVGDDNIEYYIDSCIEVSEDGSYCGNPLSGVVIDFKNYVDNLIDYENELHTECNFKYYLYNANNKFYYIILASSKDGSNRDLVIVNSEGIASYINYSNTKDMIYETKFLEKGTLSSEDIDTLSKQRTIKFNTYGCLFNINDPETVERVVISDSYRYVPFQTVDINLLNRCPNLKEIVVSENSNYSTQDGVLYNKNQTELLVYPKSKEAEEYVMPDIVIDIKEGALANIKNLKELTVSKNVGSINNLEFENSSMETINIPAGIRNIGYEIFKDCKNLKNITLPFIGRTIDDPDNLLSLFSKESNEEMESYTYDEESYFISSLETVKICDGLINSNAFVGFESHIKELELPEIIDELEVNMFDNILTSLEVLTINGVETLDTEALKGYSNLKTLNAESLNQVNSKAFNGCSKLEALNAPNIVYIGSEAFTGCNSLKELVLNNLESYEPTTFTGCTNLANISINKIETVISDSFKNITTLKTVEANSVTAIGSNAFYNTRLETFSFPNETTIGDYAFFNVTTLSNINFTNVKSIGIYAFAYTNVSYVSLSSSITTIARGAFRGSNLVYIKSDAETINQSAFQECTLLEEASMVNLKTIQRDAFSGCTKLDSISSHIIESIGMYAFKNCSSLNISDFTSAFDLGAAAFQNCTSLTNISLGNVTSIIGNLFEGCTKLVSVTSKSNITTIDSYAFTGCTKFETINLSNVTNVGINAFKDCSSLTNVELSNCTTIGNNPFTGCTSLKLLKLDKLTTLTNRLLENTTLEDATIYLNISSLNDNNKLDLALFDNIHLDKVQTIEDEMFINNSTIKSFYSTGVKEVGTKGFYSCANLTTVSLPNALTVKESAFEECKLLETLDIKAATSIGAKICKNCKALKSISFTNLTEVSASAFYYCSSLESFEGYKVQTLSNAAFEYCSSLKTLELQALETIGTYTFFSCKSLNNDFSYVNLRSIDGSAFEECSSITKLVFKYDGLEFLAASTFKGCSALKNITFEGSFAMKLNGDYFYTNQSLDCITLYNPAFANLIGTSGYRFNGAIIGRANTIKIYVDSDKSITDYMTSQNYIASNYTLNSGYTTSGNKKIYTYTKNS